MKIIEQLLALQELDLGARAGTSGARKQIEALRPEVPAPILGHYDRLVSRGKKAVALVRRGVCTGCQMQLPSGVYAKLLRDDDICVCDNCARYLVRAPDDLPGAVAVVPVAAKGRPARRRSRAAALETVPG